MKVLLLFEFIPFLIVENEHYFIQYVWRKGKDNSKTINSILWKFIYGIACICNNDAQLANVFNFYCTWRNNDRLIQWFILERSKSGVERIKSASSQVVALDTIWKISIQGQRLAIVNDDAVYCSHGTIYNVYRWEKTGGFVR